MRCLITGVSGFSGRHMADLCLKKKLEVFGLSRRQIQVQPEVSWIQADLCDPQQVRLALAQSRPDLIFHLSGVPKATNHMEFMLGNVIATWNLLMAMEAVCHEAKVFLVGSCAQYGRSPGECPISEIQPQEPGTAYGLSKQLQEVLGLFFYHKGIRVYMGRTFNLIGPGQAGDYVAVELARRIRGAARKKISCIGVSGLRCGRDFLDVRDAVQAYWDIVERGTAGIPYNICSGRCINIQELYETLCRILGMHYPVVEMEGGRSGFVAEASTIYGDPSRLARDTGWVPTITLQQSLQDFLDEDLACSALDRSCRRRALPR